MNHKHSIKIQFIALAFLMLLSATLVSSCKEEPDTPTGTTNVPEEKASCVGCHTDYQLLKTIFSPDTAAAGGGCGGETPHIEPYDRVYLGGSGYDEFKNSYHGKMKCTSCHNGVDNTGDKKVAHSNDFIRYPSTRAEEKCANCHADIVARTKNSLHEQGWGQKTMVFMRYGANSFDELPEQLKSGYKTNCSTCHGTCGDCHVNRPKAGGGGLYRGHKFLKTPDMRDNCITCHTSRGGHAYLGIGAGTVPDVHLTKAGYTCISCHTKNEVHGDGVIYDQRYKMALKPECTDCHGSVATSNMYHSTHINTFSCNTCHSQDYNNCGSCHVHGDGARIPSYLGYKIGMNPIPETKPFKYATLRRSLMAPDSWSNYGVPILNNFSVRPTFKYATPHNIQKWTKRTQVASGKPCYDNCHIIKEGTNFRNKELYLFQSDLQSWEMPASQGVIVDGKLPVSWGLVK